MNTELRQFDQFFSERIKKVPRSFIRDILQVANAPGVISFAGGLPNKNYFPVEALKKCTANVFAKNPSKALQYSNTEGLPELREKISEHYLKKDIVVPLENILITTGSQQALDIIGKVLINEGDSIVIEEPGYLGAIQAFSMYSPKFYPIPILPDGIDTELLKNRLSNQKAKFAYLVPNYQNPTGISYSKEKRIAIASLATKNNTIIIEDDPYGAINFNGIVCDSMYKYAPNQTIMLGTFSKTIVPGFRLGWVVAPKLLIEKFYIAKQAADLHTDVFAQNIVNEFLTNYPLETHMQNIIKAYKLKSECMIACLKKELPAEAIYTEPTGGMFCWVEMPSGFSSMQLFHAAIGKKVAFVPGIPFYIGQSDSTTFRLNFSCSENDEIEKGIKLLAKSIKDQLLQ